MVSYEEFILLETYLNIFSSVEKKKYVDDVWDILQKSYQSIGGIKGNGFENKETFISKLPFWKLLRKDGTIVAAIIYRDKEGRKIVAVATDGSKEGKAGLIKMFKEELELKRSYFEISGPLLKYLYNTLNKEFLLSHTVPFKYVVAILSDDKTIQPIEKDDTEAKKFPNLKI